MTEYNATLGFPKPRTSYTTVALSTTLLILAISMTSCDGAKDAPAEILTSRTGVGHLAVHLVDDPVDAKEVRVIIDELSVRPCDGGGWIDVPVNDQQYNLLDLQGGRFGNLADYDQIPAGEYCELRAVVQDPAVMVLQTGEEVTLKVPSGQSSGIKFKGRFYLIPHLKTTIVIDFDAAESIHNAGKKYVMNPVIRFQEVHYGGPAGDSVAGATLEDFVTFSITPTTAGVVKLPGGATLEFQAGSVADDLEFASAMWVSPLNDAAAPTYTFSPSYEFSVPPKFTIPLATAAPNTEVFWDYQNLQTTLSIQNGQPYASAYAPHFSCASATTRFDGLPNKEWYSDPIIHLDTNGVFDKNEFVDHFFDPQISNHEQPIMREEMVALVARATFSVEAETLPTLATPPFADVPTSNKFAKYIEHLKTKYGVISGCGNGSNFCLGTGLNRAELAKIVVETLRASGRNAQPAEWAKSYMLNPITGNGNETEFSDVHCAPGNTCPWYYGYVYAARRVGLMKGDGGGATTFRPGDLVNRVEAAQVACRLAYGTECGTCDGVRFHDLELAYPKGDAIVVANAIGGKVASGHGTVEQVESGEKWYSNTCAVRVSRSFNYSGLPIPIDFPGPLNNIISGDDGLWYAYRVGDFIPWLTEHFGAPLTYQKEEGASFDLSSLPTGVILFRIAAWDDATGHVDLLDATGHCVGDCFWGATPYEELATEILLWKID